ncbi:hypothetical protein HDU96_004339 [Phlyctochytrium bullatum]|nr:hypothetical protein HDU96_004339 [Phlyctochytrium bullatum]
MDLDMLGTGSTAGAGEEDLKVKLAFEKLDEANRLSSEVALVVAALVDQVGGGASRSKKRTRGSFSAQEDSRTVTSAKRNVVGLVGLLPSVGIGDLKSTSLLHAVIQALRSSTGLERLMMGTQQDDAHTLAHQFRLLLATMRELSPLSPTAIRPTALHRCFADLVSDRVTLSAASIAVTSNIISPLDAATAAVSSPEVLLPLILQHLLRPASYEFQERYHTCCTFCKTEVLSSPVNHSMLEISLAGITDSIPLQSLLDMRLMPLQVPFHCPYGNCAQNAIPNQLASSSPQLSARLPFLLFLLIRRDLNVFTATGTGGQQQTPTGPSQVRVTFPKDSCVTIPSNSEVNPPHQFRILAGLVKDPANGEFIMVRPLPVGSSISKINALSELSGLSSILTETRWLRCRNDRLDELDHLTDYEERGLEIIVCESLTQDV